MTAKILMYTTKSCPYCRAARSYFDQRGVSYEDVQLDEDPDRRQQLSAQYSWNTVPMILIGDEFIGGYDDLLGLEASGKLAELLSP